MKLLSSRVWMLFVALSFILPSFAVAEGEKENNQTITISTNNEVPKKTNLFVRCMRPPLKTIHTMTGTLSYFLGATTLLSTINNLSDAKNVTEKDIESWRLITIIWLANKAIYHLSDYILEEMG